MKRPSSAQIKALLKVNAREHVWHKGQFIKLSIGPHVFYSQEEGVELWELAEFQALLDAGVIEPAPEGWPHFRVKEQ